MKRMVYLNAEKAVKRAVSLKASLPLLRGVYVANREIYKIGRRKTSTLINNLVSEGKLSNFHNPRTQRGGRLKTQEGIERMEKQSKNKEKALKIRDDINFGLKEIDRLVKTTDDEASKAALIAIQAQLTNKIELKQKALSNEINNHLFLVLKLVKEKLNAGYVDTEELKSLLGILKDCSAIVGLIGKTPLVAQQFNNFNNSNDKPEKEKIQAIEVEIVSDNETKD